MSLQEGPFYSFDQAIQSPFTNGVEATVNSAMSAIQGPLTALVVLWIIVTGILVMRGDLSVRKWDHADSHCKFGSWHSDVNDTLR